MNVAVVGLWHLGSVTAACCAAAGVDTVGFDDDPATIAGLAEGRAPVYEPGLDDLVEAGLAAGRLRFSSDPAAVAEADVVWVCYDTPVDDDDRADVAFVTDRVRALFPFVKAGAVVLVSAQLPVGSVAALEQAFAAGGGTAVDFACSPENLRLGRAIEVFQGPGRIVVGTRTAQARATLGALLERFCPNLIWMSVESAEMVKHALNAFLATSITLTNEIATVSEHVGADASEVEAALRTDPRIGQSAYVKAGPAFAGGTLARDLNFLASLSHDHGVAVPVIEGAIASNRAHSMWALGQLQRRLAPLRGRTIGVLGLAYKPGTDTLRRSTSIELIRALSAEGATVQAYDPHVVRLPADLDDSVRLLGDQQAVARDADALVVASGWPELQQLTADDVADAMAGSMILDPGSVLDAGFSGHPGLQLITIGRPA